MHYMITSYAVYSSFQSVALRLQRFGPVAVSNADAVVSLFFFFFFFFLFSFFLFLSCSPSFAPGAR